jgi:ABC-type bacteriocin/lantibiotic exporter with double-glycine peptidase domain
LTQSDLLIKLPLKRSTTWLDLPWGTEFVNTFLNVVKLGRHNIPGFLLIAFLASAGTAASLVEPWIYRAIIDDVAGVFIEPEPLIQVENFFSSIGRSAEHMSKSGERVFHRPLRSTHLKAPRRTLHPRTVPQAFATVIIGALFIILLRASSQAFKMWGDNHSARLSNELERGFILRTFRHVMRLPLSYFSARASGAISHQIDQSDRVAPIFAAVSQQIWPEVFALISVVVIIFLVNAQLAAVVLMVVPIYALVTWRMSRHLDTALERYYELWDEVSSRIQQAVAGIKTVQAHGTAEYEAWELERSANLAYETYLRRNQIQNRYSYLQDLLMSISKAAVLAIGGLKALQHQLTPGDVVLFLAYVDRVYEPIEGLTGLITSLQENTGSVRRAQGLLEIETASGENLPDFKPKYGEIVFDQVSFKYARNGQQVLDGISFRIQAGEKIGLVGPSGAGKTTLADLLAALNQPLQGDIRIDDQSLREVRPSSVRASVRSVAADGQLFRDSIAGNIRYGRLDARDEEVTEAAMLAGLGPVIERLPEGLKTMIGERGVELSMGERQRVLLARAFVARPAILILDEATANLDFQTEASVKEALGRLSHGRTTILIAHHKSMLTDVNRVLVLRNGHIEQDGNPNELVNSEGYFRDFMLSQENV